MRAPQFFRTNTGHRAGRRPLAAPFIPQISFMQEVHFRRLIRSLSLRLYSLLAPRADQTRAARWPLRPPGLLLPGFQVAGSPLAPAEYDYDAKLRIAPTGLSPASTAASLAAPSHLSFSPGTLARRRSCHYPNPQDRPQTDPPAVLPPGATRSLRPLCLQLDAA